MSTAPSNSPDALLAAAILDGGLVPVCISKGGILRHTNSQFAALFGRQDDMRGLAILDVAAPSERQSVADSLSTAIDAGTPVHLHFRARRADGSEFEAKASAIRVGAPEDETLVVTLTDFSAQRESVLELQLLAFSDALTGLPNRALFQDHLRMTLMQARRHGGCFGIVVAGLDNFKEVNNTLGDEAGDNVLKAVATRLTAFKREEDTVARIGGDEFAMIVPGLARRENAVQIAGRVLEEFSEPFPADGTTTKVGVSVGIATWPENGDDVDTLYVHANTAMCAAKRAGKNRCHVAEPCADAVHAQYLPFFEWSEAQDVGIGVMDSQHKQLADLINGLGKALKAGKERKELVALFEQIGAFTHEHFATEETLMEKYGYPHKLRHNEAHRRLLEALSRLSVGLNTQSMALTMHYLHGWLFDHIKSEDWVLALFLHKSGAV